MVDQCAPIKTIKSETVMRERGRKEGGRNGGGGERGRDTQDKDIDYNLVPIHTTTYPCSVNANQLLNIFSATDSVLLSNSLGYDSATVRLTRSESNLLRIL